jgi:uncharacterized protein
MLKPVPLEELLQQPRQTLTLNFHQFLEGFDSLVPVEGWVQMAHRGTFLEVSAAASTIVTLTCHRCLQQFNHRLTLQPHEIILIRKPAAAEAAELELEMEDLVEQIPPWAVFDPSDWMYQHLYLALPQQLACGDDCQGPEIPVQAETAGIDPRWAALLALQKRLEG